MQMMGMRRRGPIPMGIGLRRVVNGIKKEIHLFKINTNPLKILF